MGEFRLGKYQLLAELARGGMGIVYLAVARGPGSFSKLLIIKELKPEFVDDPSFLSMFLEEARLAARLEHPNIVQTIEVGEEGHRHYIAMEYLKGQPLSRIRKRRPAGFNLRVELRIAAEVLRGLHHAHTLKDFDGTPAHIVHRDVSPQNVFVTYDGEAKIVDFGIAKGADTEHQTHAGMFKGKAAYIAPEQITSSTLDPRTDVFAAGILLWEAVAGRRIWQDVGDIDILKRLVHDDIPRVRAAKPDVDDELAHIIDKALSWKIDDRHDSADALATDIDGYLDRHGGPPKLREIGEVLQRAFRAEEEQLRKIIEPQLATLKRRATPGEIGPLPQLGVADGPGTTPSGAQYAPALGSGMLPTDLASQQPILDTALQRERSATSRVWLSVAAAVLPVAIVGFAWSTYGTAPAADSDHGVAAAAPAPPTRPVDPEPAPLPAADPPPAPTSPVVLAPAVTASDPQPVAVAPPAPAPPVLVAPAPPKTPARPAASNAILMPPAPAASAAPAAPSSASSPPSNVRPPASPPAAEAPSASPATAAQDSP